MSLTSFPKGHLSMSRNAIGPLAHSSPAAIILAWALTASIPLPLMILIVILRYYPHVLPTYLFRSGFLRQHPANKRMGFPFSSSPSASTPSSRTLPVSERSSYTLPALNIRPRTPPGHAPVPTHPSPSTPRKSLAGSLGNTTTPSTSKTTPNSTTTPRKSNLVHSSPSKPLCPASESLKCLSFLEPTSIPSTPRRSYTTPRRSYTRLPADNPPKPTDQIASESTPAPLVLKRRDLKHRFLVSLIVLIVIIAVYVLQGFAIAMATRYAHVSVLSQPNGKGDLGKGKEDERWLIPWAAYIFFHGGLVLGSTWIVRSFLPMIKQLDRDLMNEKGKGRQPSEDVSGDVEMQALGGEEDDAFLPTNQDEFKNLQRNDQKGKGTATEEDEEEKWTKLGFHPTSTTPQEPTLSSTPPDVELASALQQAMCFINANGEGSSSGPAYSAGDSLDERDLGIPITLLPGTANPWWAERSSAEIQLQRRNSESRKLAGQSEQDGPTKEGRAALLREELMGAPAFREHRNSWEQYNNQDEGKTNVSRPNEGKGKGKEKETPHKEDKKRANNDRPLEEPTFELPSGIDLSVDYKDNDPNDNNIGAPIHP
ncbi:MAG: hypothetical protein L6R40_003652 [Gallowayella cf. fulva]|nr:MAG: hypothetical protein L6R40_003652 [Xanthomendoza cf. fulva]